MHDTDNPTMPPPAVFRALRLDWWNRQPKRGWGEGTLYLLGDEPTAFHPLHEWEKHLDLLLSLDPCSAQAQRMVEFALKTMRWIVESESRAAAKPKKAREPLTSEERAAIARGPIKPTHRTLSMRGVLRLAREIARDEESVTGLMRPDAPEQPGSDAGARHSSRQPSVEIGKRLFKTLQADARAGRHRSLSARGAASLAMYLASVEKQEGVGGVNDEGNPVD